MIHLNYLFQFLFYKFYNIYENSLKEENHFGRTKEDINIDKYFRYITIFYKFNFE